MLNCFIDEEGESDCVNPPFIELGSKRFTDGNAEYILEKPTEQKNGLKATQFTFVPNPIAIFEPSKDPLHDLYLSK